MNFATVILAAVLTSTSGASISSNEVKLYNALARCGHALAVAQVTSESREREIKILETVSSSSAAARSDLSRSGTPVSLTLSAPGWVATFGAIVSAAIIGVIVGKAVK